MMRCRRFEVPTVGTAPSEVRRPGGEGCLEQFLPLRRLARGTGFGIKNAIEFDLKDLDVPPRHSSHLNSSSEAMLPQSTVMKLLCNSLLQVLMFLETAQAT
jgi:hypothetical protein